jgi:hypothetical protein
MQGYIPPSVLRTPSPGGGRPSYQALCQIENPNNFSHNRLAEFDNLAISGFFTS